ncbi:hypothetical protein MLD38_005338 [Melastoma candidum]|uniref:Uncharacterized protein n=1 Tax=Melastoma candidum TaxID=119954 RepID=A0ACB9S812_9MYRT|nr:hypothetical protein MLD38_005338 [Melastoma candidum]
MPRKKRHRVANMGQGHDLKTRDDRPVEILERGEIFMFYRPKVDREEAHGPDDVQRLYIVLRPESGERPVEEKQDPLSGKEGSKKQESGDNSGERVGASEGGHGSQEVNIEKEPLLRLLVMGKKSLPDPSKRSRPFWGFVEMVATRIDDVKEALRGEDYDTLTRGHRHTTEARAVGEGIYRILRHKSAGKGKSSSRNHTHLVYKLEFPREDEKNEPQHFLNIEREASFLIQIKNPDQGGGVSGSSSSRFRGLQSKRRAAFPAHLQGGFGQRGFCPADPPDFLNYEGCEFLLIAASDDVEEELGLELETESSSCSDLMRMFEMEDDSTAILRPLLRGTWA